MPIDGKLLIGRRVLIEGGCLLKGVLIEGGCLLKGGAY